MNNKKNPCLGSSLEETLEEMGLLEEARLHFMKTIIVEEIHKAMRKEKLTKSDLAKKMKTSRAAVHRLLDAHNTSVTLNTLHRAAKAVGKEMYFDFKLH